MKRILLEALVVSGLLLGLMGVTAEVRSLRQAEATSAREIARLDTLAKTADQEASTRLRGTLDDQRRSVESVSGRLAELGAKLTWVETQLDERTRQTSRQATEAISSSRELSKTVETTQKDLDQRTSQVASLADRLEAQMTEQMSRLERLQSDLRRDPTTLSAAMLSPTVQLSGDETVGSGTLVASLPAKDGNGVETYLLTAHHVVRNILADSPRIESEGMNCTIYSTGGTIQRKCDLVLRNADFDVALVKLRGRDKVPHVARMVAPADIARLSLWHPIYAVGCPLGNDPIPTGGFLANLDSQVKGISYWMINAPTYYGNSGGGIFSEHTRELIAVFSKIYTHGTTRPVVIPHMGLAVPLSQVYPWLDKEGFGFLVPGAGAAAEAAAPGR